jgi:hypothetical protein
MSNELAVITNETTVLQTFQRMPMKECLEYAKLLAESGYFVDAKQASQAFAKIVAGQELGIEPFQAMSNIHIIQGKPTLSAHVMALLVQRSGFASYRVKRLDDDCCEIEFIVNGLVNISKWDTNDTKKAKLTNLHTTYPRNMNFARAMSNGVKWFCPGVIGGSAYVEGEIPEPDPQPEKNITPDKPAIDEKPDALLDLRKLAHAQMSALSKDELAECKSEFIATHGYDKFPRLTALSEVQLNWLVTYSAPRKPVSEPTSEELFSADPSDVG